MRVVRRQAGVKKATYSKVCDTLVSLGCIKSWKRKRVDESFDDSGLWCTYIEVVQVEPGPWQVQAVSNEVYGRHAELYVYARPQGIQGIAKALIAAGIRIGDIQITRVTVPVAYFKGSHYWE